MTDCPDDPSYASGDDPAVAVLRAQVHRAGPFEGELRQLARKLKISEKVVAGFMRTHMEPLWYGEHAEEIHAFEQFARSGQHWNPRRAVRLGPQTRRLVASWLAQRAVQVAPTYDAAQTRCPSCGQLYRRGMRRGALAS